MDGMDEELKNIVFSKNVVEFVTVSVEYCAYLEGFTEDTQNDFTDKIIKLLPLLYLKATLLPDTETVEDSEPEVTVTEDLYNHISSRLYGIYAQEDVYLEVFMEDMKYSETPISASITEDLTDIYQDLKNFITIYERGIVETMNDALYVCTENFKTYWGQKLVNVLGALHSLKYGKSDYDFDSENIDDSW